MCEAGLLCDGRYNVQLMLIFLCFADLWVVGKCLSSEATDTGCQCFMDCSFLR